MGNNVTACCENCGRTAQSIELHQVTIAHHTAQLCLACENVFLLPHQRERFLQLVRTKGVTQSHGEMQKVHRLMSRLIAVGTVLVASSIVAIAVAQGIDITSFWSQDVHAIQQEPLTFLQLQAYK